MQRSEIEAIFDKSAATYDQQWSKLSPLRDALQVLMGAILTELRADARILCVGVGTGSEFIGLAQQNPGWQFTAVEPSVAMLEVCRRKAEAAGVASRCIFHAGYLESLPPCEPFDAATALLVSQFILDREARTDFFRGIGDRLRPGGLLINSELSADTTSKTYQSLSEVWWRIMRTADASPEGLDKLRAAYERDVAVLPPDDVAAIVASAGFDRPVQFLQTGLIHAWFAKRS